MKNAVWRLFPLAEAPRPATTPPSPVLRRYRLARVRLDPRPPGAGRHDHLRRMYD